jgi:hypothetical protein
MENNTESKPVLVFIPSGEYNTISHKIIFYDFLERYNFEVFKLKREYSFMQVIKILRKYNFENVIVFNFDDIAPTYLLKKVLINTAIKRGTNILEMNSGLTLFTNDKPDISTIQWFVCRGEHSKSVVRKFFKRLNEKIAMIY